MKIKIMLIAIVSILSTQLLKSQELVNSKLNESLVNGESEFYRKLSMNIRYPSEALRNGFMGLSIFNFKVNCKGEIVDLNFETRLDNGIEQEVMNQLQTIQFNWKSCEERNENELIKIIIAFGINHFYNPEGANLIVNAMGDFSVVSDKKLRNKLDKAIAKNKSNEAQEHLELLLKRYPNNEEYLKLQKDLNLK